MLSRTFLLRSNRPLGKVHEARDRDTQTKQPYPKISEDQTDIGGLNSPSMQFI